MALRIGRRGDHGWAQRQTELELQTRMRMIEAGVEPCTFATCMDAATHDVKWCRAWPAGSYEHVSGYCELHAFRLRTDELLYEGATTLYLNAPVMRCSERG